MALTLCNNHNNEVLFEEKEGVGKIILNRPIYLNCLNYEMVLQMAKVLRMYEKHPDIRLVIIKGNGRAFCSGGDIKAFTSYVTHGHWRFGAIYSKKLLTLLHMLKTYTKPVVSILDGIVMGAGAGLSMYTPFRIVTENTVFAMPEAGWGYFPDCGASHFLSRLPGFFGEYIGLTGAYLDGAEMLSCGLATHFVHSKDLDTMEEALEGLIASANANMFDIFKIINKFAWKVDLRKDSAFLRLDIINNCFSPDTVEEILSSLEKLSAAANNEEKWMIDAIKLIKLNSPISLKIFLRLIREGRKRYYEECLISEYKTFCHKIRRTIDNDFFIGSRAKLIIKDGTPQWMPSRLELVTNEMMEKYFSEVDDDDNWKPLQLPQRSAPPIFATSHL